MAARVAMLASKNTGRPVDPRVVELAASKDDLADYIQDKWFPLVFAALQGHPYVAKGYEDWVAQDAIDAIKEG